MNKTSLLLLIFTYFWQSAAVAQETNQPKLRNNTVYLEFLGNAYVYSVNYERSILVAPNLSLSGRAGFSFFDFVLSGPQLGNGPGIGNPTAWKSVSNYRFIPLTLNMFRHFDRNSLEIGAGAVNEFVKHDENKYEYKLIPTGHIGYRRFIKANKDFRMGLNFSRTQGNDKYEVFPWPYISFGLKF